MDSITYHGQCVKNCAQPTACTTTAPDMHHAPSPVAHHAPWDMHARTTNTTAIAIKHDSATVGPTRRPGLVRAARIPLMPGELCAGKLKAMPYSDLPFLEIP